MSSIMFETIHEKKIRELKSLTTDVKDAIEFITQKKAMVVGSRRWERQ